MVAAVAFVSIVIEWENARRTGDERARLMLSELQRQLGVVHAAGLERSELIFVCDVDAEEIQIREALRQASRLASDVRILRSQGGDYYEQKNHGAASARGDVVIFLDSDVVPKPGWLAGLLAPFADPATSVVSGTSFIEVSGLYSAAMALGWLFPLPSGARGLCESPIFWANNVAFRGALIRRRPFPRTGQYRGQCIALAERLRGEGHVVIMNHGAGVAHPPPEGLAAFAVRALRRGHDEAAALRRRGRAVFRAGSAATAKAMATALSNVWRRHREVGLGAPGAAAAAAILVAYYALQYGGFLAACLAPGAVSRLLVGAPPRHAAAEFGAARG